MNSCERGFFRIIICVSFTYCLHCQGRCGAVSRAVLSKYILNYTCYTSAILRSPWPLYGSGGNTYLRTGNTYLRTGSMCSSCTDLSVLWCCQVTGVIFLHNSQITPSFQQHPWEKLRHIMWAEFFNIQFDLPDLFHEFTSRGAMSFPQVGTVSWSRSEYTHMRSWDSSYQANYRLK